MEKQVTEDMTGTKIYLLGIDQNGKKQWLEAPSWDCDWYWGFGYIEEYTWHNSPENSKDIVSHTHWDNYITSKVTSHPNGKNSNLKETVLTDKESWALTELMESFYILQKTASLFYLGGSHISNVDGFTLKDKKLAKHINKELLPKIFDKIDKILTPNEDK